jgi:cytochrome c peroxidase
MYINSEGLGNPIKRPCSTCHGRHMTAMDVANGWMDLGTTNLPWAKEAPVSPWATRENEMPLFKLTCRKDLPPHPFLGREIYTQDPGRALITGKCDDIGAIVIQQFRGLAARAPYFSNGSAASLREVIDYYDRRYNIQYSEQEKRDLANFLGVL